MAVPQIVEKLLGPLWEGAPPAGGGGESFTQARRFRAKARLSPSGPSGHLPPRGRFFDTQRDRLGGPFVGGYILSAARTATKRELCGDVLENFLLYCQMPGSDWAFIFWLTFADGQTKSSRMGVKMSSRTPGSRASQPWMMPSVFSIVSPAVTSRTSSPMVKRKRPDTT